MDSVQSNETEVATLRLNVPQDGADFSVHNAEDANRWLASQNLNVVDRSLKGDIGIYVSLRSRGNVQQGDFAFFRIPADAEASGADDVSSATMVGDPRIVEGRWAGDDQRLEGEVFSGVSNLVSGPQGIIPSRVRLVAFKDRADFRGQILAAAGHVVPPFLLARTKRKLGSLEQRASGSDSRGVADLIEDGTEVVSGVEQDAGKHLREWSEPDFVKIAAGISVFINEAGPWLACNELVDQSFELIDVVLCTRQR